MRKLILIALGASLAGCTVHYTPDIERFHLLDSALNTKADAETTGKNFKYVVDRINAMQQEITDIKGGTQTPAAAPAK